MTAGKGKKANTLNEPGNTGVGGKREGRETGGWHSAHGRGGEGTC